MLGSIQAWVEKIRDLFVGLRSAQWDDGKFQSDVDSRWRRQFDDDMAVGSSVVSSRTKLGPLVFL